MVSLLISQFIKYYWLILSPCTCFSISVIRYCAKLQGILFVQIPIYHMIPPERQLTGPEFVSNHEMKSSKQSECPRTFFINRNDPGISDTEPSSQHCGITWRGSSLSHPAVVISFDLGLRSLFHTFGQDLKTGLWKNLPELHKLIKMGKAMQTSSESDLRTELAWNRPTG